MNGVQHDALVEHGLDPAKADNRIIGAALGQSRQAATMMVSNDAALRIKAAHLGLSAIEHQPTGGKREIRQAGWHIVDTDTQIIDALYRDGTVAVNESTHQADHTPAGIDLALSVDTAPLVRENEYVVFRAGRSLPLLDDAEPSFTSSRTPRHSLGACILEIRNSDSQSISFSTPMFR